jgi:hypothetical protein
MYNGNNFKQFTNMAILSYGQVGWRSSAVAPLGPQLLDTYGGAKAAYSLRKIRTDYTGFAIRVRRSNDNASQDIGFKSDGTLDTTSLLSFVGANSGFISIWYDQANNYDLIQATALNQLRIVSSGVLDTLNGKPSAYNSAGGVNRFMKVSFGANLSQPNTYFHLGSHTNAVGYILDNESGATQSAIYQASGTSLRLFAGSDLSLTYTPNIAAQRLIFAMTNSTTSRLGVNGATGSTGNANTGFMNGVTLGASVSSTSGNFAHHQELIIFNSNQLTNRAGIEANINSFYTTY